MHGNEVAHAHSYQLPISLAPYLVPKELASYVPRSQSKQIEGLQSDVEQYLAGVSEADIFVLGVGATGSSRSALLDYGVSCLEACVHFRDDKYAGEWYRTDLKRNRVEWYYSNMSDEFGFVGDIMYCPFVSKVNDNAPASDLDDCFMTKGKLARCLESEEKEPRTPLFKEFAARLHSHAQSVAVETVRDATINPKKHVVLVASGEPKWRAMWSLLIAGIGSTLVIDQEMGEYLLRRIEP